MTGISEITLRASDGRERQTLVWFPNEQVRQDYYAKARKRGLEIIEKEISMRQYGKAAEGDVYVRNAGPHAGAHGGPHTGAHGERWLVSGERCVVSASNSRNGDVRDDVP